jgi:tRNA(fMet)-specific endonuclease VapC
MGAKKLILMSGRFILDTNIVIAIFSGETSIKEHLLKADEVFISSTVLGELFFGAFKSKRSKTNLKRISDFADSITILNCDKDTAYQYGIVKK